MDVEWLEPERPDARTVAEAVAIVEAARAIDAPHQLPPTVSSFTARLRHGGDGDPAATAVARDGAASR